MTRISDAQSAFVLGSALLAVLAVSCGSDSDTASQSTATAVVSATETPVSEPSEFRRILRLMPDTPESRVYTRVNRLHAQAALLGIAVPEAGATFSEIKQYRIDLGYESFRSGLYLAGEEWLSGFFRDYLETIPDTTSSLGFGSHDIAISAVSGEAFDNPKPIVEIVTGEIDPQKAAVLLAECAECPGPPIVNEYSNHLYYSWGRDFEGRLDNDIKPPAFDHIGRGGRLFFEDGIGARALRDQDIEAVIDVQVGTRVSLGDIEAWSLAADAVAELGALSATFTNRIDTTISNWPEYVALDKIRRSNLEPEVAERFDKYDEIAAAISASAPILPEFELVATGVGIDDDSGFAALAIVFRDEPTAEQAASALRERATTGLAITGSLEPAPWAEMIESAEIKVRGRLVTARIFSVSPEGGRLTGLSPFLMKYPFITDVPFVSFLLR